MQSDKPSRIKPLLIIIVLAAAVWFFQGDKIIGSLRYFNVLPPKGMAENIITDTVPAHAPQINSVTFNAYIPPPQPGERMPVVIFIGGYGSNGRGYMMRSMANRADRDRFVILAPAFTEDGGDFGKKQSYHYPAAWSGKTLDRMLEKLSAHAGVNATEVYMYGFSAGAQVSHRYALLRPDIVKGVAAHAAGGFTFPTRNIPTQFRISVGKNDSRRLKNARIFVRKALAKGIAVHLEVYSNMSHHQSADQFDDSMRFLMHLRQI